jgi:ABC-2 type transport system ATP-binding protein
MGQMGRPAVAPAIEAKGLCKYYGPFAAIRDLSFEILSGQVVALLGPNGAGKSTTLRILTGFLAPSEGTARVGGHDIAQDRLQAASCIGYLPENGPLYYDMTAVQSLGFFAEARLMPAAMRQLRIGEVVDMCGLREIAEKPIGQLSKGLRQRVGLAQALVHDPQILILDEPTAGLDPNQIRDFRTLVERLRRQKTLLVSTHILPEADAVADRVLLLHRGRLAFDGTPAEMKQNGSLEAAFYRLTGSTAQDFASSSARPGRSREKSSAEMM